MKCMLIDNIYLIYIIKLETVLQWHEYIVTLYSMVNNSKMV